MMMLGAPPSLVSSTPKRPSVYHCKERGNAADMSEGAEARLRKIVTRKVEETLRDRGRSRDRRQTSSVRDVAAQKEPSPTQGSQESPRVRTPSGTRNKGADKDPSQGRTRSVSLNRTCFKCQGKGHIIADCPSVNWYKKDGTLDEDRNNIERKNRPGDPNGNRTPPRPA